MESFLSEIQPYLLWGFVFFCVVPVLLGMLAVYLAIRRLRHTLVTDAAEMQAELERMRVRHPKATDAQLIQRVIQRQSLKSGVIGAITSVGGFITLPLTLPIDLFWSVRIQAQMVEFIAAASGVTQLNPNEARIQQYLITTGGVRAAQSGTRRALGFAVRLLGKSFSKLVPLIGALIGFGVNYAITQAIGRGALRWYSHRRDQLGDGSAAQLESGT